MESRPEPRLSTDLLVRVWGMGADGKPFFQNARARNISSEGARLSGLEQRLSVGDVIGVQLREHKARFRVIWVIDAGSLQKIQTGVKLVDGQEIPWRDELTAPPPPPAPSAENKRKFKRHKIKFPIELHDERGGRAHMQTSATDIAGRGCYVETMLPMPLGTAVHITFWMESEKIQVSGVVRASDPGVGMGIEFTGLDEEAQQRFQNLLDKMDAETAGPSPAEGS